MRTPTTHVELLNIWHGIWRNHGRNAIGPTRNKPPSIFAHSLRVDVRALTLAHASPCCVKKCLLPFGALLAHESFAGPASLRFVSKARNPAATSFVRAAPACDKIIHKQVGVGSLARGVAGLESAVAGYVVWHLRVYPGLEPLLIPLEPAYHVLLVEARVVM